MHSSEILLHPVRLRIAQVLLGTPGLSPHRLHERLPDVPIATLYRHVNALERAGLLEVLDERRVRGATERSYRLAPGISNPTAEDLRALSRDQLEQVFTVFVSGVIRDFGQYLAVGQPDLADDRVSFGQASFWADDAEVDAFGQALVGLLGGLMANEATSGRRRRTLTTILMPRDVDVDADTDVDADDTADRPDAAVSEREDER
ncbi:MULTISPECIES: helix-turn-helix domain-containing protein [Curtobacterium]|uniref:helix-turn-helix domain-containing protein n=1 Tax=Curtobacterium TaxID=2034 RepID=UPI0009E0116F|nr:MULTISPECIES: helix-turn-helix domain-containing protein [Curtobacterium]